MSETRNVADITVPSSARDGLNILHLVGSIERVGLLHPVVLNTRNELIAGRRRLAAVKSMGWKKVPVRVVRSLDDAALALLAERDENTCRERLTHEEMIEIGAKLEALEGPAAKKRQGSRTDKPSGKLPEGSAGDTRDKVAGALGVSGKTYEKMKQVAGAARKEPEKFGDLPALMDTKSVDAAHRALRERQKPNPEAKADVGDARSGEPSSVAGGTKPDPERATRSAPRVGGVVEADRVEERQQAAPQAVEPPAPQRDAEPARPDPAVADREQDRRQSIITAGKLVPCQVLILG